MRPLILVPTINSRHWHACYLERPHTARYPPCTPKPMADPPPAAALCCWGGRDPPPSSSALPVGGAGISVYRQQL